MKKKLLSILLAVCILASTVAVGFAVFAANAPTYNVDVNADGKTVTVTVTLPGSANVAGGNCTLQYDNAKLTFGETIENAPMNVVNPNFSENSVRFSFAQAVNIVKDTVLWKMTFTLKDGKTVSADDFKVTEFRMYNENSKLVSSGDSAKTEIHFSCTHATTKEEVKDATYTEPGYKKTICTVCGEVLKTEEIPTLVKPTEPTTKPVETTKPIETTKPVETTKPAETTKPEETLPDPTNPPKPTFPVITTKPVDPTKPVETTKPTPTQPIDPTKPVDTTKPVETTKPAEPTKPIETTTKKAETTVKIDETTASAVAPIEPVDTTSAQNTTDSTVRPETPNTGDSTNIAIVLVVMLAAAGVTTIAVVGKKKKYNA